MISIFILNNPVEIKSKIALINMLSYRVVTPIFGHAIKINSEETYCTVYKENVVEDLNYEEIEIVQVLEVPRSNCNKKKDRAIFILFKYKISNLNYAIDNRIMEVNKICDNDKDNSIIIVFRKAPRLSLFIYDEFINKYALTIIMKKGK